MQEHLKIFVCTITMESEALFTNKLESINIACIYIKLLFCQLVLLTKKFQCSDLTS